ncbi:hypothetical protein ACN47E_009696 [Coniothyrium glycines]
MALHNQGVPFTIYEEAKGYTAVGAGIGFAPNGMLAMDLIEPRFRHAYDRVCVGNKPSEAQNVFFRGLLLEKRLEQAWSSNSTWGHENFTRKSAHRKDLLDIMTSYLPQENVRFNKRLVRIEEQNGQTLAKFADGDTVQANVLVGADGINSVVRKHVLSVQYPEQVDPVYAKSYCYRGVIAMKEAQEILGDLTDIATFYFGHRRSTVTYRIFKGEEFNFLLCVASDDPWPHANTVTEEVDHDTMMANFVGSHIDPRFRQLLEKAPPVRWGLFHHRLTSTYYRNHVVLLGDSAHASLPFQAAGAAQGVEDALVLSNLLEAVAKSASGMSDTRHKLSAALLAYDQVRRPRAQRQLEQSAEVAQMIFFQHEAGSDMNCILPLLQNEWFEWLWFHDVQRDVISALDILRAVD